ncbi:hypothetical protein EON66_05185 [archaeon]|nr:MAG: hypothetical protein EON66_05185 [archaeon]
MCITQVKALPVDEDGEGDEGDASAGPTHAPSASTGDAMTSTCGRQSCVQASAEGPAHPAAVHVR